MPLLLSLPALLLSGCSLLDPGKGGDPTYDFEFRHLDWTPTAAEEAAFEEAAARWSAVLRSGIPDSRLRVTQAQIDSLPAAEGCQPIDERIDDQVIFVRYDPNLQSLASNKICTQDFRGHTLPNSSLMTVGPLIRDGGAYEASRVDVLVHELGHALGFSPKLYNLDADRDGVPDRELVPGYADTCPTDSAYVYVGAQGVAAWQALGGEGDVPMEPGPTDPANPDEGNGCVHLSEAAFGEAIMTPYGSAPGVPITPVTLGILADIGYDVDLDGADPYVLPGMSGDTGVDSGGAR